MISIPAENCSTIAYHKTGSGPVIILLHGFPENSGIWHNILPRLSVSYTVITPDIPGAGSSTLPTVETSMEQLAQSIKAIIDNEQLDKVLLAGHSMGGYISCAFADLYPQHLRGVTLIHSTQAADTEEKKENRRKAVALIKKGGKEQFLRAAIPNMFTDYFKKKHPEVIEKQVQRGMELSEKSMIAYYNAMTERPDRIEAIKNADFPIQWIFGKEDKLIGLSDTMPLARLNSVSFISVYDDCGHMSMLQMPEKLTDNIEEFASYCYKS